MAQDEYTPIDIGGGGTPEPSVNETAQVQITIGGVDYTEKAQIGFVLDDIASQDKLDSFSLILSDVNKTIFEAFTDVVITTPTNKTYYMYVDTYVESQYDINNLTYSYDMSLMSRTKILERVILPNLKIRKPISGDNMTIGSYLQLVVFPYIYKQFPFLSLSDDLKNISEKCPDIEWSTPKAKDVINDLLMTIPNNPCYVRVTNNVLVRESLSQKGTDISQLIIDKAIEDTNYEQMSQFANNIVMDLKNIVSKKENRHLIISPRAINQARLTTDNLLLFLGEDASIETITRINAFIPNCTGRLISTNTDVYTNKTLKVDITDFIVESAVYKGLLSGSPASADYPIIADVPPSTLKQYKVGNLTFTQNGNTIEGLNNKLSFWEDASSQPAIINILLNKLNYLTEEDKAMNPDVGFDGIKWRTNIGSTYADQSRDLVFEIFYIQNGSGRVVISKDVPEEKDCSIEIGQNQTAVDLKTAMQNARETVNRLGNTGRPVTLILDYATDYIPQLRDYAGDYIVSSRQIAFWHDFCIVKLEMTENFLQKHLYYGIANRKKYTQLAMQNETTIREDYHKIKINFSLSVLTLANPLYRLDSYIPLFFNGTENKNIKVAEISTSASGIFSIYPSVYAGDKSVLLTMQCADNYSVGMTVLSDYDQTYGKYVDDNGKITNYRVYLHTELVSDVTDPEITKQMPMVGIGAYDKYILNSLYNFYKDNSETLKITYQFEFIGDGDSVIVGTGIGNNNILVNKASITNCKLIASTGYVDKKYPVIPAGTSREVKLIMDGTEFTVTDNYIEIEEEINSNENSWMIVDSVTEEIVLAVNRNKTTGTIPTRIYVWSNES